MTDESKSTRTPAFEFTVSEPEKKEQKGKMDFSYWVYHIFVKTTLPSFGQQEFICIRRYNDFAWFRNLLLETYPGIVVPPIPEKSFKGALEKVMNLNANPLLEYRQRALHKFLVRVGAHPILSTSNTLRDFLALSEEDFERYKSNIKKKSGPGIAQSFKEFTFSITKSVSATQALMNPTAPSSGGASAPTPPTDDKWIETRNYLEQLERSLTLLKDRIELLIKRRRETSASLLEFGRSFVKIGEIEGSYEEGPLSKALTDVGNHSENLSNMYQEQADAETFQVIETITYYVSLIASVRDVIKHIHKLAHTRDTFRHSLNQLHEKRQKLQQANPAAKEDTLRKLDLDISNTTQRLEDAEKEITEVETTFQDELKKFHREKQYDIKQMLKAFVDLQVEYAQKMKTSWDSVLPSINAIPATAPAVSTVDTSSSSSSKPSS